MGVTEACALPLNVGGNDRNLEAADEGPETGTPLSLLLLAKRFIILYSNFPI